MSLKRFQGGAVSGGYGLVAVSETLVAGLPVGSCWSLVGSWSAPGRLLVDFHSWLGIPSLVVILYPSSVLQARADVTSV